MSGSISLSLSQQFDSTGAPLNGGLLYFYAAGTTTPQSAYQDTSLTIPWPNPIVLDSAGRIPAFYLADGQIKIRLTDSAGVVQVAADNLLVIGASSGSGSAPSVDATTILATGDVKFRYGTGALSGFVRLNGRTIGSATSGGTERANADCQSLFEYLWAADSTLSVSTGRGVSANADWVANKNITLPDCRGKALAGLDDMGNSTAGILTGTNFGVTPTTLGAVGGSEKHTIAQANLPNVNLSSASLTASTSLTNNNNVHRGNTPGGSATAGGVTIYRSVDISTDTITATTTLGGSVPLGGSGTALPTVSPLMLVTVYMKL